MHSIKRVLAFGVVALAALVAGAQPVINTLPDSTNKCVGGSVTFIVAATGIDPLSYQWYLSTDTETNAITDAIAASYTIASVVAGNAGGYTVVVTDSSGSTTSSPPAVLTINSLPSVSVNSATICAGGSATLNATTDASSSTYLWSPGNATTASITVSPGSTTTYTVTVTDGTTTCSGSASGTVTVQAVTTAAINGGNATNACPGSSVTFTATAGGTGPFSYTFRKGTTVVQGPGAANTFTIAPVGIADGGSYSVDISGTCGSASATGAVTVVTAPVITAQPQNVNGFQGNSATFSVTATGALLGYQWRSNGVNITGATSASYTINNLLCAYNASYDVVVNNCAGSATSTAAVLTVQPSSSVYFDFNTPGQYANNFQNAVPGLRPAAWTYSNALSGGVANTADIDFGPSAGGVDSTAVFMNNAYDFSYSGAVLNISMLVKVKAPSANNRLLQIGFVNRPSTLTGERLTAFMSARVNSTAQPALSFAIQHQGKVNVGTGTIDGTQSSAVTLVAGNWYKLSITFTNIKATTANSYTVTANFQDMGADGQTVGTVALSTGPTTVANADVVNDSSVYGAFRAFDNAGADALDNLSISISSGQPFVTCSPTNQTVLQGRPYVIRAYVGGSGPMTYQWNRNGSPIIGANDWQITNSAASFADNGAVYSLTVNGTLTTAGGTLTVLADAQPPTLISASSFDGAEVGVCFDEPLDPVTAANPANYTIVGGPAVASAVLRSDNQSVSLGLAGQVTGTFTVQVSNVKDRFNNTITSGSSTAGKVNTAGFVLTDLNNPSPAGSVYSCKDGEYEVTAGGADIWANADQGSILTVQRSGDFDVRVLVANETYNIGNGGQITKAGLLARESLDAFARNLDDYVMPQWPGLNRYEAGLRPSPSADTAGWGVAGDPSNQGNVAANHPTSWIRLRRVGDTFTGYSSSNGVDWVANAQTTQTFSNNTYVGLMMTAHSSDLASVAIPSNFTSTALFKNFGDTPGYGGAVISITSNLNPANTNLNAFQSAVFTMGASISGAPSSELQYQWQRSNGSGGFTNIPGANAASAVYTTVPLTAADLPSAQWRCIVRAAGAASVTSSVSSVNTITDTAGPTISSAFSPTGGVQQVVVVFSEPVSAGTADVTANYTITNASLASLGVSSAAFYGDTRTILLTLASPLTLGTVNGVVVNNVRDRSAGANLIAANSFKAFTPNYSLAVSNVVVERFLANNATPGPKAWIEALLAESKFINNAPDNINYTNSFCWNQAISDTGVNNYGARITSYFTPLTNAQYRFYTRSDDLNRLYMNTNSANSTDPAGKVVIADQNLACCKNYGDTSGGPNVSPVITLVAGQKYYLEALFKEGIGGDGFEMAFRDLVSDPSGTAPANTEVAGAQFFTLPTGPAAVTTITPSSITVPENGFATFSVSGISGALPYKFQWLKDGALVPNATALSANLGPFSISDTSVSFVVSNLFSRAVVSAAVTVTADNTAPTIVRAFGDIYFSSATVVFSEPITQASAEQISNYSIPGLTILSARLQADGKSVVLTTSPQTQGQTYTITINGIQDRAATPNTIAPGSTITFSGWVVSFGSVKVELFTGNASLPAPRTSVPDLQLEPKFIANTPDFILYTNIFAFNQGLASSGRDNYGARLTAYFIPPSNGVYRFYIRSDDLSQLSLNAAGTDPAGMVVIAKQNVACCKNYGDLSGGQNTSAGIPLAGGQKYYMEALFKEGIGGDGFTLAWREQSNPSVPPNSEAASAANFATIDNGDVIPGTVTIVQQPVDAGDVQLNHPISFSVGATATAGFVIGYQWQKDGADIPLANNATLLIPRAQFSDSGSYSVKVSIPGHAVSSTSASANVVPDTTGPNVIAGFGDPIPNHLRIVFDEVVAAEGASNPDNYYFSGGLPVTNATLLADGKTVLLMVAAAIDPASDYTLEALDVRDLSGNRLVIQDTAQFTAPWICTNGVVLREEFFGNATALPGAYLFSTLTNNPHFPNNPDYVDYLTTFNSPQSSPNIENFSTHVSGFLIPTVSGNYSFQVHADDSGLLLISQDAGRENGKTVIRAEGSCAACGNPQGGPVTLTAGNAYYVEAFMMEGAGGDYIDVSWKPPGASAFTIIPGANLAYCVDPDAVSLQITSQPHDVTVLERRTATFTSTAAGTGPIAYQWQQFDPNLSVWVNIDNATNSTFRITPTDASVQNGTMYQMLATLSGGLVNRTVNSDPATLYVVDDLAAPSALSAYSLSGTTVKLIFDEDLDYNTATDAPSYAFDSGVNVTRATLLPGDNGVSNTVLLTLDAQLPASTFTVSGGVTDGGGNGAGFSIDGKVFALGGGLIDDGVVGTSADPIEKGSTTADANRLEVVAGGSDIWNNGDGFRYAWGTYTNDFDVKVRVSSLDPRDRWSKAGFVVREDLTPGSRDLSAVVTPDAVPALDGLNTPPMGANDYEAGSRGLTGGATADWGNFGRPTPVPYPNAWVRLRRTGGTFSAYWANDGLNWTAFATTNTTYPSVVYLGLGTTAHNNGVGQITTAVYQDFGLILPPSILTPPQSQTVTQGSPVTFTVSASGEAPFTYQWRKDGSAILGANGSTYNIGSAQASDQGSYDVIVSNLVGSATSAAATLTVVVPPVITREPDDQTVACQSDATFSVTAVGIGLTYQWYLNDTTTLTDETNATLTLHHVTLANNGNYKVVVTDLAGSTTSRNALLTVTDSDPPVIVLLGANPITVECHGAFADPGATASDGCAGDLTAQIVRTGAVNPNAPGTYLLHYNVSDPSGNPAVEVTRTVNVVDTIAPTVTCPADISICTSSNSAIVTFTLPTAADSCDPSPSVTADPASGSEFPVGTSTVTVTARDASGNPATCTFKVAVAHANAPTLTDISYSGGTFRFSFLSQDHCTYLIQYKDTVDAASWTTLKTVNGDGLVQLVEDAAGGSSRFYQVKVQ